MPFVLDCSVVLSWLLPDEHSVEVDALADRLTQDVAVVPPLWPLEVGNVLLIASRQRRITSDDRAQLLAELRALPVEIDAMATEQALSDTLDLADKHGLTLYDAAYLELAKRKQVPLATLDAHLRDACTMAGVESLP